MTEQNREMMGSFDEEDMETLYHSFPRLDAHLEPRPGRMGMIEQKLAILLKVWIGLGLCGLREEEEIPLIPLVTDLKDVGVDFGLDDDDADLVAMVMAHQDSRLLQVRKGVSYLRVPRLRRWFEDVDGDVDEEEEEFSS